MAVKRGAEARLETLGERIKAARQHAGMSQVALAAGLRQRVDEVVAQDYVSRWETGISGTSDAMVRAIAQVLDVSAGWLTHGDVPGVAVPVWARPKPSVSRITEADVDRATDSVTGKAARRKRGATGD